MTEPTKNNVQLSTSQRVLLALKEAKLKLESYERQKSEPIAIIGMGCRFPGGADTPEKYWEFLRSGKSGICEIPKDRWNVDSLYDSNPDAPGKIYIRRGGFINHTDQFDPAFFRISPREAESLDPQHRLFLEVAWESLEHAGIDPKTLTGSLTGVFAGIGQNDYSRLQFNCGDLSRITAYDGTGNLFCFVSGRLSFILGLNGPNLTMDTACSSSLVAIHLACQSLRAGECNMAIAGGVHLVFSPEVTVFLCRTRVLSPDGLCRTFDAGANGFGRGEGCGVIVLKRLSDALAQHDNILALIRGSAINHDGAGSGLTVPNELAQEALIRQAIANAKIDPTTIGYIEAHGTGTSLGDPIELSALASVFQNHPLYLGSVKTNFGHLEAAAGIAGLIKTVLALQHHKIPPHLHFNRPTPHFDWNRYAFNIPTQNIEWTTNRIAGVSSFGMSGTNAHIILEESPTPDSHLKAGKQHHVFQKERYWVETQTVDLSVRRSAASEAVHPLLGERLRLPFSQEIRFENFLTPAAPSFMNEHRIFQRVISPAAAHISTVLSAAQSAFGKAACVIEDVFFSRALELSESSARTVQLILTPLNNESNLYEFRLISCDKTASMTENLGKAKEPSDSSWILHAEGRVRTLSEHPMLKFQAEIQNIQQRCPKIISGVQFYNDLRNAGYQLGTPFQWGENFWFNHTEALCSIKKPVFQDKIDEYPLYPGLADTCFQLLSNFWEQTPAELAGSNELYVPFSISELKFYQQPAEKSLWCYATASHKKNTGDLCLFDEKGTIYAQVSGFEFRTANRQALFQATEPEGNNWLYQCVWEPKPIVSEGGRKENSPNIPAEKNHWLIFADNQGIGKGLALRLEAMGHEALLIFHEPASVEKPVYYQQLIAEKTWTGVVHLWNLDIQSLNSRFESTYLSVLRLIQALAKAEPLSRPWLWVITQGVYAAELSSGSAACFQAPIWGLSKTVALEHPDISCVCVDLPAVAAAASDEEQRLSSLMQELLTPDGESYVLWRDGVRQVARLKKFSPHKSAKKEISDFSRLDSDASYLITGGLGALGLHAAQWLVNQGGRYLVLLGRRSPHEAANKQIDKMTQTGATVRVIQADVGDHDAMSAVFAQIQAELPALKGVIHAAGVIDDAVLLRQDARRFKAVMQPKIDGAWNLHLLTQTLRLDFLVFFSSIAALLGSPGQGNYSAANAFMDALARYRRSSGLPAISIQWGAWADSGMAAALNEQQQQRRIGQGMGLISADQGMSLLGRLLSADASEAAVIPVDWERYSASLPSMPKFLSYCVPSAAPHLSFGLKPQPATKDFKTFGLRLRQTPPLERRAMILEQVRSLAASVLKLKSAQKLQARQRLFDAGIDSLMAVELRNLLSAAIEKPLPATLVFDYPTVDAITDYLCQNTLDINTASAASASDEHVDHHKLDALLDDVAGMSEDDLLKELRGTK